MIEQPTLLLIRGLPGAGKTTLANTIAKLNPSDTVVCAADEHFEQPDGSYKFEASQLPDAHTKCKAKAANAMSERTALVIVTNTFTTDAEVQPYLSMATILNYRVQSVVVENRAGTVNVHGVPDEAMDKMHKRFSLKLR